MRRGACVTLVSVLVGAAAAQLGACVFSTDLTCDNARVDCQDGVGGEYIAPICKGNPTEDPNAVDDVCGVFVDATAAEGGDGTKAKPFRSFAEAAAAAPRRVYACGGEYRESAGVVFKERVEIYAGFTECDSAWTWAADANATLQGPADEVALTLRGGVSHVENLNVIAADAAADGGSSIAVMLTGGEVELVNGEIKAGSAKDGATGDERDVDPSLDGEAGDAGIGVCSGGANNPGPTGKMKACPSGGESAGGKGGDGGEIVMSMPAPAGDGEDGTPPDPTQPTRGLGGAGEGQGTPATTECSDGSSGSSGVSGQPGGGARGTGTLSEAGYQGMRGEAGTNGTPGQGGGGGGGAKGRLNVTCGVSTSNRVGASGGAGGTGGCGGQGGGGGQPGGSSIALVVLEASVTMRDVTLTPGRAGNGGRGGNGQSGGQKGTGGGSGSGAAGANASCRGGDGGKGGDGAPGGGGQGGHSLGIAFQGTTPPTGGTIVLEPRNQALGGPGGANNTLDDGGKGDDGVLESCWDFSMNAGCAR